MPLLLADASPIIAFCNGHEQRLLANVVQAAFQGIEVPHFVDQEIRLKCNRVGAENYLTLKADGVVHVYEEAFLYGIDEDIVMHVLDMLDLEDGDYKTRMKDGGEAFAVAYAARHRRNGQQATILMDDRQGRTWAKREQIPVHGTLWVFEEAKRMGLIATAVAMSSAYESVRQFTRALRNLSEEPELLSGLP